MSIQLPSFPNANSGRTWIFGLVALLFACVLFRGALTELPRRWNTQEEYSYGYLVPLVSAWLLWARRHVLATSIGRPAWTAPILVAVAMFVHIVGALSSILIFSELAFVLALFGITLAIGGFPLLRTSFIPLAFLVFAIPLPSFVNSSLTLEFELISSRLGGAFLSSFGVPVYLEGNLIDLGTYKLQVVEACSGLRYLFPLLSLSFLTAYLFQASVWMRAMVLFSSVPITIAMNGLRIGLTGLAVDRWGPRLADGVLHLFEGWVIFVACTLLLLLEVYLLARLSGKRFSECFGIVTPPQQFRSAAQPACRKPRYACLVLIVATLLTSTIVGNRQEVIPQRNRFVTFPTNMGNWHGRTSLLEPEVQQILAFDDYILSDYTDGAGKTVDLYVAYYSSQHRSKYHSPSECIPGDGWSITTFERTMFDVGHPINRVVIEKDGSRQLVYYWYEERGRRIASEYWSRWYLIYDALAMNRSDGALVRLVTPIMPDELDKDADIRLRLFVHDLEPTLNRFLTSSDVKKNTKVDRRSPPGAAPSNPA